MQVVFIPYGNREWVERFLRALENQRMLLKYYKEKKEKFYRFVPSIRQLPLGAYAYVFPKEALDAVLTTLRFKQMGDFGGGLERYNIGFVKQFGLRKLFNCNKWDENFKSDKQLMVWDDITENSVQIIPVGIKEDGEITEPDGRDKGWTHEAI